MSALSSVTTEHLNRTAEFRRDVLCGLNAPSRFLPSKYFYDEIGSGLFDTICDLDEYYPTRLETEIMERNATSMSAQMGSDIRLVEYGSGSSVKTRVLLDHLIDPTAYVPVDISAEHLMRTAEDLAREYPLLDVSPVVADFTAPFSLPPAPFGTARQCVYFPGSTIGNFGPDEASRLLQAMASMVDDGGGLLIGFDLQKPVSVLEAAYNDSQRVTADFNKNLLVRINRELDGDFDLDQFDHLAFYNCVAGRIEMHLVSQCEQDVRVGDQHFALGWGETIRTEYSYKYTLEGFAKMAAQAGWSRKQVWTDPKQYFAVMYFERLSG